MAEDETNGGRISVSRDALRAELAGLELRLVNRITEELSRKADHKNVADLEKRVNALETHEEAQRVLETSRRKDKRDGLTTFQTFAVGLSTLVSTTALFVSGFIWVYYHHHG